MRDEFGLIQKLIRMRPRALRGAVTGDDTAVLPWTSQKSLLFTTDVIVEGVDFLLKGKGKALPQAIGHKALAVNLSDIAAMGGVPLAFVVGWGFPKSFSENFVLRVAQGILRLAKQFHVAWVGGDLSSSRKFFIAISLLGEVPKREIVYRKGARPGDLLYVTGTLGGSILKKHLTFTPRLREARFLARQFHPTSMIDISDGFLQDLGHLLSKSRAGAKLDLSQIPVSADARRLAKGSRREALRRALTDGEDFELLFTLPRSRSEALERAWKRKFKTPLTRVGEMTNRAGEIAYAERGRRLSRLGFRKKGFVHF